MGRVSPGIRTFNAGEFSELLEGRVDLDRYPASARSMHNMIAAPQGPAISRSGTAFVTTNRDEALTSALVPFVYSEDDASMLEFSTDRIRFMDEDGLLTHTSPVAASVVSLALAPIQLDIVGFGGAIGDQIALSGFPASYNLNGEVANVTNKVGDVYTLDINYPNEAVVAGTAALVYHVDCAYTAAQLAELNYEQSVDVLYLLTSRRTRKLSRFGALDWRLEDISFIDGPYMPVNYTETELTPSATGNAVPDMTSDTAPSGVCRGDSNRPAIAGTFAVPVEFLGRELTYDLDASQYYYAFDADDDTYWAASAAQQEGVIQYDPPAAFACNGYAIHAARDNQDASYLSKDYAPSTFTFEGYDGSVWVVLDRHEDYVLYDGHKSAFFELTNTTAYRKYRLVIKKLTRNGLIEARVRRLTMRGTASASFTLTASATTGINFDAGFATTDVGRLIRIKGSDGAWRACEITAFTSSLTVTVELKSDPLMDLSPIREWRLGYWSDTTGWPAVAHFYGDRLWLMGPEGSPDQFAGSVVGAYENFTQADAQGVVFDDSAVVSRLNSRKSSRIKWVSSDTRGLLMGTGSEEYALVPLEGEVLTPRNAKAKPATRRGSSDVKPVEIDDKVLFVQKSGRAVREFTYAAEIGGYRSPSMSQLAGHIGAVPFAEMAYAAEPHSIVWHRRSDGSLVGLTYNRDENVVGWHQHDLSGGVVERLATLPQKDQQQDALWVSVKRTVDGNTRRYIERLTRFWDFDTALADAHFVDSGLRYSGAEVSTIYGLQHLEGEDVYGLANGIPIGPLTVANGRVSLPFPATDVLLGLGYDSELETPRLENGAADGTAQGKQKRINTVIMSLWRSFGGEVGVHNEQADQSGDDPVVYEPLEYPGRYDEFEDIALYTGMTSPVTMSQGYEERGSVYFRRLKDSPLPFNVIAVLPQLNTQVG